MLPYTDLIIDMNALPVTTNLIDFVYYARKNNCN